MDKQAKITWIALLCSSVLFAAWAQQGALPIPWPVETLGESSHKELAQRLDSPSQAKSYPTTQRAITAAAHSAARHAPGDIDGDGRSDLLLENRAFNFAAYWIMEGATPTRYSPAFTPPIDQIQVARGDFNGDGKLDLVWARTRPFIGPVRPPGSPPPTKLVMWLGDGNGFTAVNIGDNAEGWSVVGAGDIDGDGKSDLLLINHGLAYFAYWKMDGAQVAAYSPVFARPADSVLATTGDFNGDGKLDLVWENGVAGPWTLWAGNGVGFQSMDLAVSPLQGVNAVIGAGDIDGDGKSDLLMIDASGAFRYLIMDGARQVRSSVLFPRPDGASRPLPGDYNGDGKLDVIWERNHERGLVYWQGDGNGFATAPMGGYAPNWRPVSPVRKVPFRGDIDGDERSDLLLVNDSEGLITYWAMNGARVVHFSRVAFAFPAGGYRPMFSAEFTGDGLLDLAWFREQDASSVIWTGDGSGFRALPATAGYGGIPYVTLKESNQRYHRDTLSFYLPQQDSKYSARIGDGRYIYSAAPFDGPRPANGWERLLAVVGGLEVKRSATGRAVELPAETVPLSEGWNVVGEGDIDGDDLEDLILENREGIAYWIIRAGKVARYSVGFLSPLGHQRVAMGDYNGDGKLDIVWARESDRSLLLWQGDGDGFVQAPIGNYAAGWRVFGKDSAINYPPPGGVWWLWDRSSRALSIGLIPLSA